MLRPVGPSLLPPRISPNRPLVRAKASIGIDEQRSYTVVGEAPPAAHEFRATWIATTSNIDWPSRAGLPVEQQKAELLAMLDKAKKTGLNAVILQVRSNCDALYKSDIDPWSPALSGTMGQDPGYDPLAFAIEEAHKRGLQLHAWFNPFRAGSVKGTFSSDHVVNRHPEWVRKYGTQYWLDPGLPEVQQYAQQVMLDVLKRYDVDAIHMDDYFYPYPIARRARSVSFPDYQTYKAYQQAGGTLSQADWRRDNINRFVRSTGELVHAEKPGMSFGISPFGIWKPGHPPGTSGMSQYDEIFADARLWLQQGWVDYFAPQLYWAIEKPGQAFGKLPKWWTEQNPFGRHIYPGMNTSNVGKEWPASQILRQIGIQRDTPGADGHIHFSVKPIVNNPDNLVEGLSDTYATPALVPTSPWLDDVPPAAPEATLSADRSRVTWTPVDEMDVFQWVVYTRQDGQWKHVIVPADQRELVFEINAPDAIEIAAVDRSGNESQRARLDLI
jgi:uncharacterized lipoprotein YddW (UPF0748 family)